MTPALRNAVLLALIAGLAVAVTLAWRQWTQAPIAEAEQQLHARRWLAALPQDSYDNQPLQAPLPLAATRLPHSQLLAGYRATRAGKPSAILLRSQTQGYGGPILLMIAIDPDGRLLGIQVLEQQESPGLGARLADPQAHWLEQFSGRTRAGSWALKRDQGEFDQLAGATVTSRAVIAALQDALRYFDEHRASLLGEDAHE
ncbi:RnfABCDGE type electron transport complex subunit G [Pseudomonas guariconensis]|uniref:RnfABCDGE type electron transport complex subunit G n=1 Tax=Pseudomonas TaxID=286 RepID=UPI001CE3D67D|nr:MULTISPECIES: RnfABCDGE type electron transport complex subunit G [Pseudomonas]MCO7637268.1 RnfABCDGE type electron transport complex subunit G [Pseudomonas sp. S 311-6]MCO7517378.1 RnfABCDGE type electron transport complex subunit G [Pseudomonas putida]MCO7567360.1 RnfABCDGE type electron transport complex subunit G [Pseudomonas mosselii]MCO7607673.1 RnfABCDGE type electron transport complex subunit G [Pseudomonas guariconensis]MCO7618754.1 RnfABCDGE type electron transport complex subunit